MEKPIKEVFQENLRYYLSVSGKQQKDLAKYVGVKNPSVHRWVHGTGFPQLDKIDPICSFFGISRYQLVTERNGFITKRLTESEDILLNKYNQLNIDGKMELEKHADLLTESNKYKKGMNISAIS